MKIAIEAQRIFRINKHGMDFVALESIKKLQIIDKINQYYILVAPGKDRCLEETNNFKIIEFGTSIYPIWEQLQLPRIINELKPDFLHCTSNTAPIYCNCPLIITLHDIIFLESHISENRSIYQNFGWYYRKFIVPKLLKKCIKVITVSNYERKKIIDSTHISPERIISIYNGYNDRFHEMSKQDYTKITNKYITTEDYILFLGNTDPKKNVPKTLKAYSIYLKKSSVKMKLLIADIKKETLLSILKDESITEIKDYIISPGYISNNDLASLYNGAKIFLYTSLRESFGIPILESMACGTPVITSNTSAIPEIVGKNGILVNPKDENEIAKHIIDLEENSNYYNQAKNYGLERVKEYSWENNAHSLLELYTQLFNKCYNQK